MGDFCGDGHPGHRAGTGTGARRRPDAGAGAGMPGAARRAGRRPAGPRPRGAAEVVRGRGGGRGHRLSEDGRVPGGLPFLLAVRRLRLTGPGGLAGHPGAGPRGAGDGGHGGDGVLHRRGRARSGPAPHGAGARRRGRHPGRGRHQCRVLAGHADPRPGRRARRVRRAPLQPQPRDGPVAFRARRDHPLVRGALGHLPAGARGGDGAVLRRHRRDGGERRAAGRVRRAAGHARPGRGAAELPEPAAGHAVRGPGADARRRRAPRGGRLPPGHAGARSCASPAVARSRWATWPSGACAAA